MQKEIPRSIICIMARGIPNKGLTKRIKKVRIIQAEKGTSSSIFSCKESRRLVKGGEESALRIHPGASAPKEE